MIASNITFDSLDFSFDPLKVQASGGSIQLLDLGGGTFDTSNPSVIFNGFIEFASLTSLVFNSVVGEVHYIFLKNGNSMYYSAGVWAPSDGSFAQSNLWSDFGGTPLTVIQSLYSPGDYFSFVLFLHSDGTHQSGVGSVSMSYQIQSAEFPPVLTQVTGSILNIIGKNIPDKDITLSVQLFGPVSNSGTFIILDGIPIDIPVVNGAFSVYLTNTDDMGIGFYYAWTLNGNVLKRQVSKTGSINFIDLPIAF